MYILSQIFALLASLSLGCTYFVNNKTKIMIFCLLYCIFYGTHYLLLGAITGALITLVSLIRNIIFYINSKKKQENSKLLLILLIIFALISGILSYQNIFSILLIIASVISTYSVWQDDVQKYKLLALPVGICYLVYGISINSIASIITETVLLIAVIVGIKKMYNKKIKKKLDLNKNKL